MPQVTGLNEYQVLAARTDRETSEKDGILHAAMGMVGEAAEALDHVKKVLEQGHPLDKDKLIEEAGDNLWYIAKLARYCDVTLEELAQRNIGKLQKRYPDGFSEEKSINRQACRQKTCWYCDHYTVSKKWCAKHQEEHSPEFQCGEWVLWEGGNND